MYCYYYCAVVRFGERAKRIQNAVRVNEELGIGEYKALVASYRAEIAQLKQGLSARGEVGGVSPALPVPEAPATTPMPEPEPEEDVELLKYRLLELTTELESERTLCTTHQVTIRGLQADADMNRCLIRELEDKLFKVRVVCMCRCDCSNLLCNG